MTSPRTPSAGAFRRLCEQDAPRSPCHALPRLATARSLTPRFGSLHALSRFSRPVGGLFYARCPPRCRLEASFACSFLGASNFVHTRSQIQSRQRYDATGERNRDALAPRWMLIAQASCGSHESSSLTSGKVLANEAIPLLLAICVRGQAGYNRRAECVLG